jgi:hypothetical protein
MITPETDGFKVFAAWNHQGMILRRRSRAPAQLAKLDTVLDPGRYWVGRTARLAPRSGAHRQNGSGLRFSIGQAPFLDFFARHQEIVWTLDSIGLLICR